MDKDTITMIAKVTNESYVNGISKGRLEAFAETIAYLQGHHKGKHTAAIGTLITTLEDWILNESQHEIKD